MFQKILKLALRHKTAAGIITLVVVGGYYGYGRLSGTGNETRYVSVAVQQGTLVVSVSGSGQVSAFNQVDIKPKASGNIISIGAKDGQWARSGTLIAEIDATDARKSVRDAELNLESAKLSLQVLKESGANISKLASDGFNEIADTFLELPSVISSLKSELYDTTISSYENLLEPNDGPLIRPLIRLAQQKYAEARIAYDKNFSDYHNVSRYDSNETITSLIVETADTTTKIADAIKSFINVIDYVNDYNFTRNRTLTAALANLLVKYRNDMTTYTSQINSHISSLNSIESSIDNAPRNISSQELSVKQRENALLDAKEKLSNYFVHAPFDGIIVGLNVQKGDAVSASTVITAFITKQKVAEVFLNEVDITKIKIGDKTTLTFDAIPDLNITGRVTEIGSIGTITQGVVTYAAKIVFDTQDERVKPGMSVSVAIITDVRQDVLLVPNSAVKQQGDHLYVEIFTGETQSPRQQIIKAGLFNDTMTEIINGLDEGNRVVTQTINPTTQNPTQRTTNSSLRIPGVTGGSFR